MTEKQWVDVVGANAAEGVLSNHNHLVQETWVCDKNISEEDV